MDPQYEIAVGIRYATAEEEEHWVVILKPCADPANCVWYHSGGYGFPECDPYRRAKHEQRQWETQFFNWQASVARTRISETQLDELEDAFKTTPPHQSHHFVCGFLRNLVNNGILQEWQISWVEQEVERTFGPCPPDVESEENAQPPSPRSPKESPLIFQMDSP